MNKSTTSVPAPPGLSPPESSLPVDTLQDMIARKRDADRNKLRYHLTEADCNLLCTHGVPTRFSVGEVIMPADGLMTKAYRIKSGNVGLMKEDLKIKELTRGFFIGEALFLRSAPKSMLGLSAVAATDVELIEINLPFVRQLLTLDKIMAFKVYRHLASKLSAFLFMSLSHIADDPDLQFQVLTRHLNSSGSSDLSTGSDNGSDTGSVVDEALTSSSISISSSSSTSSVTSVSSTSIPIPSSSLSDSSSNAASEDISMQIYLKLKNSKNVQNLTPPRRKKSNRVKTTPFRSFTLDSPHGQCLLYPERIKFTCTIRQRKIKYNQILDATKVGPTSVTIIHGIQAKTIFFKTEDDMNEFMGLVQSLRLSTSTKQSPSSSVASPLSFSYDDVTESDKVLLHSLSVKQDLKKGDVIIAEGDLFQRVYTVVSGEITSMKGDRQLMKIEPGETFGILSLFHLRPSMVNLVVTSDTATVLIIPGYKILDLVNTNFPLAVRMYKKAAHVIHAQLEHMTGNSPVVKGSNRALV